MNESLFQENRNLPEVELFTDGACIGNPGPGGWAYILRHKGKRDIKATGGEERTTNNRMELAAVIEGLKRLGEPHRVHLHGDSKYVLQGISEWMHAWKRKGWRKADRKPVLNDDLWKELDELTQKHEVKVTWVAGHSGHPENEWCDEAATREAEKRMGSGR